LLLASLAARRSAGAELRSRSAGGLTAYVPWHYRALARSVPPIDDMTTDTDNPPAFIAVIKLREAEDSNPSTYAGAETAALQKRGYPDLAPLSLALAPEKAFPLALATAKKMSWTIVAADPTTRRIEASEQSFWMGFTDDIVVHVAEAGSGSPHRRALRLVRRAQRSWRQRRPHPHLPRRSSRCGEARPLTGDRRFESALLGQRVYRASGESGSLYRAPGPSRQPLVKRLGERPRSDDAVVRCPRDPYCRRR
jgi:Protein of unknown function (DUF1499)